MPLPGSARGWMLVLSLAGLAVSAYLAVVHHAQGEVPLACATGGVVNCEVVTTSAQSMVGPVAVADLGVVWFAGLLALLAVEGRGPVDTLLRLDMVWAAGGLAVVLYLVYAELFLIGAICAWCTAVHVLTIALFLLALARVAGPAEADSDAQMAAERAV